jgi:AcrR family transcriptional regulator
MNKSESKYFNTAVRFDRALISLLEKKSFEYITISEICKTAGVNRSTFYLHYENTCDLLKETTKYLIDQFTSYFSVDVQSVVSSFSECPLNDLNFITDKYLYPYLSYIKENQRVFWAALSHPSDFRLDLIFQRLFDFIFDPILDRFHYPIDERKYVMMFYLNGVTAIIKEWIQNKCEKSIDEISEIIRHCILGKENQLLSQM